MLAWSWVGTELSLVTPSIRAFPDRFERSNWKPESFSQGRNFFGLGHCTYSVTHIKGTLLRAGGALKFWRKHRITGIGPIRPRVKLVLLFLDLFCGSAT